MQQIELQARGDREKLMLRTTLQAYESSGGLAHLKTGFANLLQA